MRTLNLFASLACGALLAAGPGELQVSGPYTHDNLSLFLIHGNGKSSGQNYVTLKDALEQNRVKVYETQNVNELAIENLSDNDVFVQGGDIVKGGQQDRVISNDFVLPAKSGRLPISAFCVEPGRWTQRGAEPARTFSASTVTIVNPDMAIAVKDKKNQAEVWNEVAKTQAALDSSTSRSSSGSGSGPGIGLATSGVVTRSDARRTGGVRAFSSPSSLQLTLESQPVEKAVEGYLKTLASVVDGKPDVVGFAFAVNGRVASADVYASPAVFRAMWPKLLKSSAVEAVRVREKSLVFSAPPASAVEALLQAQEGAKTSTVNAGRVELVRNETDRQLMFESRAGDAWIHRNYIAK